MMRQKEIIVSRPNRAEEKETHPRGLPAQNMGTSRGADPGRRTQKFAAAAKPRIPVAGCPGRTWELWSGWATRLPRPGHPRAPRRRTTTSAIRGGRSTARAPPCRRTSSPTPTSARTSSTSSTAASSYVLLHFTPPRRSSLVSVLCSPSSLRSAFRIRRACVPALSFRQCRTVERLHSSGDFRDLGIWRGGCFRRSVPLGRSNSLRFFSTTQKSKTKTNLRAMVGLRKSGTIHFAISPPELSVITASPRAAVAFGYPVGLLGHHNE